MSKYVGFVHNNPITTTAEILAVIANVSASEVIYVNRVYLLNLNAKNMNSISVYFSLNKIEGLQDISFQQIGQIVPQNKSCLNLDSIIVGASNNNTYGGTSTVLRRGEASLATVSVLPTSDTLLRISKEYACIYDNNNSNTQSIVLRQNEALSLVSPLALSSTSVPFATIFEFNTI